MSTSIFAALLVLAANCLTQLQCVIDTLVVAEWCQFCWYWTYTLASYLRDRARACQRVRSSIVYMPELAHFVTRRMCEKYWHANLAIPLSVAFVI